MFPVEAHISVVPNGQVQCGASTLPPAQVVHSEQEVHAVHLSEHPIQTGLAPSSKYPIAQEQFGASILLLAQIVQDSAFSEQVEHL